MEQKVFFSLDGNFGVYKYCEGMVLTIYLFINLDMDFFSLGEMTI